MALPLARVQASMMSILALAASAAARARAAVSPAGAPGAAGVPGAGAGVAPGVGRGNVPCAKAVHDPQRNAIESAAAKIGSGLYKPARLNSILGMASSL